MAPVAAVAQVAVAAADTKILHNFLRGPQFPGSFSIFYPVLETGYMSILKIIA